MIQLVNFELPETNDEYVCLTPHHRDYAKELFFYIRSAHKLRHEDDLEKFSEWANNQSVFNLKFSSRQPGIDIEFLDNKIKVFVKETHRNWYYKLSDYTFKYIAEEVCQ